MTHCPLWTSDRPTAPPSTTTRLPCMPTFLDLCPPETGSTWEPGRRSPSIRIADHDVFVLFLGHEAEQPRAFLGNRSRVLCRQFDERAYRERPFGDSPQPPVEPAH